jgi:hypothetical protein
MKLDAFGAYQRYLALKLHFTNDNYDIKKSKGRTKASKAAFLKRRDVNTFARMASKLSEKELIHAMVANFITGDNYGGLYSPDAMKIYNNWQKQIESLTYIYKEDITYLVEQTKPTSMEDFIQKLSDCSDGHPLILKAHLGQKIHLETLVILERTVRLISDLDTALFGDFVWSSVSRLINKYKPFLKIDTERMLQITHSIVKEAVS